MYLLVFNMKQLLANLYLSANCSMIKVTVQEEFKCKLSLKEKRDGYVVMATYIFLNYTAHVQFYQEEADKCSVVVQPYRLI